MQCTQQGQTQRPPQTESERWMVLSHLVFIYIFKICICLSSANERNGKKVRNHSKKCLWCNKNECNIMNSRGIKSLPTTEIRNGWRIHAPLVDLFVRVYERWQGEPSIKMPWDRDEDHSAELFCFPSQIKKKNHAHTSFSRGAMGKCSFSVTEASLKILRELFKSQGFWVTHNRMYTRMSWNAAFKISSLTRVAHPFTVSKVSGKTTRNFRSLRLTLCRHCKFMSFSKGANSQRADAVCFTSHGRN